jgi:hypothetical protein
VGPAVLDQPAALGQSASNCARLLLFEGGEITSTFDDPSNVKLGTAAVVEEMMIGEVRRRQRAGQTVRVDVQRYSMEWSWGWTQQ